MLTYAQGNNSPSTKHCILSHRYSDERKTLFSIILQYHVCVNCPIVIMYLISTVNISDRLCHVIVIDRVEECPGALLYS